MRPWLLVVLVLCPVLTGPLRTARDTGEEAGEVLGEPDQAAVVVPSADDANLDPTVHKHKEKKEKVVVAATKTAIVSDKELIEDPAFNISNVFPTKAPPNKKASDNENETIIDSDKVVVVDDGNGTDNHGTKKKKDGGGDQEKKKGADKEETKDADSDGDVLVNFDVKPKVNETVAEAEPEKDSADET